MLISCRPSFPSQYIVSWPTKVREFSNIAGRNVFVLVMKNKTFDTYADAEGFHSGLVSRGINAQLRSKENALLDLSSTSIL